MKNIKFKSTLTIFTLLVFLTQPFYQSQADDVDSETSERYFNQEEVQNYSIANSVDGDTFYVDTANGNDSNDGLSPNLAFKTIKKALNRYNSNNVRGGDVLKIKAGVYRESVSLSLTSDQKQSLSSDKPFVIGPYGDGEVIIDPSKTPLDWIAHDSNIFVADWTYEHDPWAVVMNDDFKSFRDKQQLSDLDSYGFWYYDVNSKKIYINSSGQNPIEHDVVITFFNRSAEHYGLKLNGNSHIRVYGLTVRGASRYGITDYPGGDDVKIEKCTIKFNNSTGTRLFSSNSSYIKNHVWGNMLYNWPRGRIWAANGGWGQGMTISNHGLASGNIVHDNGGEGIGVYGGDGYTTFEDNISYDNYSVGLYLDNAPHCIFRRNLVYSNDPDISLAVEEWQLPQWIIDAGEETAELKKIYARMRQEGIMMGDEKYTNLVAQSVGHNINNNIIIGARRGILTYGQASGAGLREFTITNNTIILPSVVSSYGEFAGLLIDSDNPNNIGTVIKNNIIYSPTSEPVVHADLGEFIEVELDNNQYYSPVNIDAFRLGHYPSEIDNSFNDWKSLTARDTLSIFSDPEFGGVFEAVGYDNILKFTINNGEDFQIVRTGDAPETIADPETSDNSGDDSEENNNSETDPEEAADDQSSSDDTPETIVDSDPETSDNSGDDSEENNNSGTNSGETADDQSSSGDSVDNDEGDTPDSSSIDDTVSSSDDGDNLSGEIDSLVGKNKEIVEEIANTEATKISIHNSFVGLTQSEVAVYQKVVREEIIEKVKYSIAYFIHNGTATTKKLGAGERAGVISSFRSVFGTMPETLEDWQDVIKIANGRWTTKRNLQAEEKAKIIFQKIYLRDANMDNPHDNAAVTVITYGLRPANRNMNSEKVALKTFRHIYKKDPSSAQDWDIVRAISYSGASRS